MFLQMRKHSPDQNVFLRNFENDNYNEKNFTRITKNLPEVLDLVIEHLLHDFLQFLDIHET